MAKKIAAPYKAVSKAPARKKAKAKAVSAPKTYKPKGSAKEKLSYLNKQEMAALVKRKGSPARRGPSGLPSFADDSASSKGVSRGDSSGTKSSSSGNKSGVGGGGGGGGGSTGSRGSSTGSVGSRSGSNAPGNSGMGGGGKSGPGGPSGPNSAASGTRGSGRPSSPMGGQGASFSSPKAAKTANENYTDRYGFQNKVNSRLPSAIKDIEDIRGRMGPFKGPNPDGSMFDEDGYAFNPNKPMTRQKNAEDWRREHQNEDELDRAVVPGRAKDKYRTPQEIREDARKFGEAYNRRYGEQLRSKAGYDLGPRLESRLSKQARANASDRTPDTRVGGHKTNFGGYRAGGAVKTFKKK